MLCAVTRRFYVLGILGPSSEVSCAQIFKAFWKLSLGSCLPTGGLKSKVQRNKSLKTKEKNTDQVGWRRVLLVILTPESWAFPVFESLSRVLRCIFPLTFWCHDLELLRFRPYFCDAATRWWKGIGCLEGSSHRDVVWSMEGRFGVFFWFVSFWKPGRLTFVEFCPR